jgi:tetratricopeptide (TPR) repeat protein
MKEPRPLERLKTPAADVARLLPRAIALSRSGEFAQAEQACRQVLALQPAEPTALHLLGVCMLQQGRAAEAERALAACLQAQADEPAALANRAIALHALGRFDEALLCYERALALAPRQPETRHMRGLTLMELKRYDEALDEFDQALEIAPTFAEAWCSRGNALIQLRQYEPALVSLDRAENLRRDYGEALSNRSIVLNLLRRHEAALVAAQRASALLPDRAVVHRNMADALVGLHRDHEALDRFDRAIALDPGSSRLLAAKADLLSSLGREREAAEHHALALSLLQSSTRDLLCELPADGRVDASVGWRLAELNFERGQLLADTGEHRAAVDAFVEAARWRPDFVYAYWSEALVRLRLGDYEEGWRKYEWRRRKPDFTNVLRRFDAPDWTGDDDPAGLRILLHAEQGLGDVLQFCRYAPLLAQRGAQVIIAVHPPLKRLLGSLPGVTVLADGEALPSFDRHCPIMSLPYAFRTALATVPAAVPYLHADRERVAYWQQRLGQRRAPRVGLVWSGNPRHANDRARSMPAAELAPLFALDADFIALNKEVRDDEREIVTQLPLRRLGEEVTDFADTAALIENLDLVISVDTSVAHLAGALARPVWVLLDTRSDFRWLIERDDSPWYPTARLFRQNRRGDWREVIECVVRELAGLLATRKSQLGPLGDFTRDPARTAASPASER